MSCWTSLAESHLLLHVEMPLWFLKFVKKKKRSFLLDQVYAIKEKYTKIFINYQTQLKQNNMKAMTKGMEETSGNKKKFSNSDFKYHYS
jgi:hypothetical protein